MKQENTIFQSNITTLKKHHAEVYEQITNPDIEPAGKVITLDNGSKNLKLLDQNKEVYYLHGNSGPIEDSTEFFKLIPPDFSGVVVMIGFGLGIPSLEILKKRPGLRHFIIFESNLGVFKQALLANDLSRLFSDKRVILCLDKKPRLDQVFFKAFKALELEDIQILKHMPSLKTTPEYEDLYHNIFESLNTFSIRGATTKSLGKKFTRNRFQNLKRFRHDIIIDSLENCYKNVPAVLIAGGPSLDKNISKLKQFKGRAVLFAVDSVVPMLLDNGIIPDFISSIDPQHVTLKKYSGADLGQKDISLICSAWVTPRVPFHLPVERVIWTFGGRPIEQWINTMVGGHKTYIGAGSVAHLNMHVALDMGCDPIILVGQDLAYSDEKDHASNVVIRDNSHMETVLKSKSDWAWIKGYYGDDVKTSRSFLNNKTVFEEIIASNKPYQFINATEGGAHIEGTKAMALSDVFKTMPPSSSTLLREITPYAKSMGEKTIERIGQELEKFVERGAKILKKIKTMSTITSETRKKIHRLQKNTQKINAFSDLPVQTQKKVARIDQLSAELDNQGIYWHLLDEVTFEGLHQSEKMLFNINRQELDSYLDWLMKNLDRLEYINGVRKKNISWLNKDISGVIDFHKKESVLLSDMAEQKITNLQLFAICKFYSDQGIYALAMKYLEKLDTSFYDPEIDYIKGCCYAFCGKNKTADRYFSRAIQVQSDLSKKIDVFRTELANDHLNFGQKLVEFDSNTPRTLFLEGLHYNPDHEGLLESINDLLVAEIKDVKPLIERKKPTKVHHKIIPWLDHINADQLLEKSLDKKNLAEFYSCAGQVAVLQTDLKAAFDLFLKSAQYTPDNPTYYVQLTDLCFSIEDYTNGVKFLNKAVELDRSNARIWELIGDRMLGAKNLEDALAAYEKCFVETHENIHLLQKIAHTCAAMGKPESAKEAMMQYEKLLNTNTRKK